MQMNTAEVFQKKILHIAHCVHSSAGGRSENRGGGTKKEGLLQ